MVPEQMGRFICALRKEQGLTQKGLAERLKITDKAVSKWERGISCPDISLLPALAAALGVTVNELLAGAREAAPPPPTAESRPAASAPAVPVLPQNGPDLAPALPPTRHRPHISPPLRRRCAMLWILLLLIAVGVCLICDLAISGGLSWSLYPAAACLFAGCVTMPLIRRGAKGVRPALCRLTLLIGPFLAAIDWQLARSDPRAPVSILPIGLAAALPGLLFLWGCYATASLFRGRPLRTGAVCAGLAAAACLAENALLAPLLNLRLLDVWDGLTMLLLALLAAVLLWLDKWTAARR